MRVGAGEGEHGGRGELGGRNGAEHLAHRLSGGKVVHRVRIQGALPKDQAEALQANIKQKIPSLDPILMAAER